MVHTSFLLCAPSSFILSSCPHSWMSLHFFDLPRKMPGRISGSSELPLSSFLFVFLSLSKLMLPDRFSCSIWKMSGPDSSAAILALLLPKRRAGPVFTLAPIPCFSFHPPLVASTAPLPTSSPKNFFPQSAKGQFCPIFGFRFLEPVPFPRASFLLVLAVPFPFH